MAMSVSPFWTADLGIISPGWNDRTRPSVPDIFTELVGSIAAITDNITRRVGKIIKESTGGWQFMRLPG